MERNTTTERVRKVGEIEFKDRDTTRPLNMPKTEIDISSLSGTSIPRSIFNRGVELNRLKRAKRSPIYPWIYHVSGGDNMTGTTVYSVNLATHSCPCLWNQNTGTTCKHLVAGLLAYIEHAGGTSKLT